MEKPDKAVLESLLAFSLAILDRQAQAFGVRAVMLICDTEDGTSVTLNPALNEAERRIIEEKFRPVVLETAREVEALRKQKSGSRLM